MGAVEVCGFVVVGLVVEVGVPGPEGVGFVGMVGSAVGGRLADALGNPGEVIESPVTGEVDVTIVVVVDTVDVVVVTCVVADVVLAVVVDATTVDDVVPAEVDNGVPVDGELVDNGELPADEDNGAPPIWSLIFPLDLRRKEVGESFSLSLPEKSETIRSVSCDFDLRLSYLGVSFVGEVLTSFSIFSRSLSLPFDFVSFDFCFS